MSQPRSTAADRETDPAWTPSELKRDPHAVPDKADRVRRMFAGIAGRYDLNNRLHSFGLDQRWRKRAVKLAGVGPGDDVLDVACGTGDLSEAFAAAGAGSVIGVDFTEEMLVIARQKARRHQDRFSHSGQPRYVQGDAMNLPFGSTSFDVVAIAFGIRNVADPLIALREFRRVLRTGGRLVVLEFSQPRNRLVRAVNNLYCRYIMPFTAAMIARDRVGAYRYLPRSVSTFPEGSQFAQLVLDAGFTDVQRHPMALGVCTAYMARIR
jgi:demethylmenaquinone methyltransferase/2-methoxy-6-polyprenyl-1,4-benzoquinol methylase